MVDILSDVAVLRALLTEQKRQGADKKRQGWEQERLADAKLALLDRIEGEVKRLLSGSGDADASWGPILTLGMPQDAWSARPVPVESLWGSVRHPWAYLTPDYDGETGAPVYDTRVVGLRATNRHRAFAAARVYGKILHISSLADAIYRTGETRAADAASVKSSLFGLVRYGQDWRRKDGGWLEYVGEGLSPNREMIALLDGERQDGQQQVDQA